jgi:hypothetical protein
MKNIIPLLLLSTCFNLFAAEADNFSRRNEKFEDMADMINLKANGYVVDAVNAANELGDCKEAVLYTELQKYFANHNSGELAKYILLDKEVSKNIIPLKESVYKNWTIFNGYLLGRKKAAQSPLALAPLVRVGNQVVGTDKFEHMFGMGMTYFRKHYLEGKSMRKVFNGGVFLEKTALGGNFLATGVFSYGDLSANFNGMRFWNHMLQKHDDILGKEMNLGPYITCQENKFTIVKEIDFRNYIDPSMDESVNCAKFANGAGLRKFNESLKRLGNLTCPMNPELNLKMQQKYAVPMEGTDYTIADWIINKSSNEEVSYFFEF